MITATADSTNDFVDDSSIEYLLSLLDQSSVSPEEYIILRDEIETFQIMQGRYDELSIYLYQHQVCPISAGRNYQMTYITKKINREI